jgi:hypothetical protein
MIVVGRLRHLVSRLIALLGHVRGQVSEVDVVSLACLLV